MIIIENQMGENSETEFTEYEQDALGKRTAAIPNEQISRLKDSLADAQDIINIRVQQAKNSDEEIFQNDEN